MLPHASGQPGKATGAAKIVTISESSSAATMVPNFAFVEGVEANNAIFHTYSSVQCKGTYLCQTLHAVVHGVIGSSASFLLIKKKGK